MGRNIGGLRPLSSSTSPARSEGLEASAVELYALKARMEAFLKEWQNFEPQDAKRVLKALEEPRTDEEVEEILAAGKLSEKTGPA